MSWGAVAGAVVGGVMGSGGSSSSQTTTNQIDPRFARLLFGEDDKSGFLGDVSAWYQANKSGLNPQMAQGLNTQLAVLNDPGTMAGYQQMASLGSGLMGAPVMGNPFSDGRIALGGGGKSAPNLGMGSGSQPAQQFPSFQRAPNASTVNASAPGPFTATPATPPAAAPAGPAVDPTLPDWAQGQTPDWQGRIQHPNGTQYMKAPKGYFGGNWVEVPYGGNGA